jgi:hypothetical protein
MSDLTEKQKACLPGYIDAAHEFLFACSSIAKDLDAMTSYQILHLGEKTLDLEIAILPFHNWTYCRKCGEKTNVIGDVANCRCGAEFIPF